MIAEDRSSKEIAFELGKSIKTIDACRRRILEKLGASGVAGITRYVLEKEFGHH